MERDLLSPAIKGTTEILKAIKAHAPQVKRIVITSSFAAIVDLSKGTRPGYTYSEKDWNPVTYEEAKAGNGSTAYCGSKTFAEKAAWEFVEKEKPNFTVSTINPPMIYGPLDQDASIDHLNTSSKDVYRFFDGSQKEPGPTGFPGRSICCYCTVQVSFFDCSHHNPASKGSHPAPLLLCC